MTQEDKQLLFKDICARMPYQVKVMRIEHTTSVDTIESVEILNSEWLKEFFTEGVEFKPYLRSMSSMTDEERKIVNSLIYNKESIWTSPIPVWVIDESDIEKYIDLCNSHHLDYRELIPMGLALEAPEDMYKTE